METEISLTYSQEPIYGSNPEENQSSPHPPVVFQKIDLYIILLSMIKSSRFTGQCLVYVFRLTATACIANMLTVAVRI
jgi:hypothetical protein